MTETVFEIIPRKNGKNEKKQCQKLNYNQYLNQFISKSYGYYTQIFISQIISSACLNYSFLLKFNLKKVLRQIVRKMLLTDLQLVFLAYFANLHQWNTAHETIVSHLQDSKISCCDIKQQNDHTSLKIFLLLLAYFVKSYISSLQQVEAITKHLNQQCVIFTQIYNEWIQKNPKEYFIISPRNLNSIYTNFTKNNFKTQKTKDYNSIVNKILELSTPYSMIPSQNPHKKIHKNQQDQKNINNFLSKVECKESSYIKQSKQEVNNNNNNNNRHKIKLKIKNSSTKNHSNMVNEVVNDYFKQKSSCIIEEPKGETANINSSSAFFSISSSRYSALPINFRTNSNIFGSKLC